MRLILHIGTHKTGTSALQKCLQGSEQALAENGIHYVRPARSKNANALARLVAKGRGAEVETFFKRHIDKVNALGADTLVISAESFYAMALFFHKFNGRADGYWKRESDAVGLLRSVLPPEMSIELVVFFRRQDHFLESIYGQLLKGMKALAMPIEEFSVFMSEALDYWRHIEIWSGVFPGCAVYTYEEVAENISRFFLRNVLRLPNLEGFKGLELRYNIRLNRDVLEYKRMLNRTQISAVDMRMSKFACAELARTLGDDGQYHEYLAPDTRVALLRQVERGNALLSERFGMKPFPALSSDHLQGWTPYPGLSTERVRELAECHARIRKSAGYRIERWALLARQFIRHRLPILVWALPLGRSLLPRHRKPR